MEHFRDHIVGSTTARCVIAGVAVSAATAFVVKKFFWSERRPTTPSTYCPPGSVLLVQLPRGPHAPSMSPFPMKLETYLRIAEIPYVTDTQGIMSDKGKTPWIIYNGEQVADSQIALEFLNKKFSKDLNSHLSKQDRAVAEAIRVMVDEHMYWCYVFFRWVDDDDLQMVRKAFSTPRVVLGYIQKKMDGYLKAQGLGRHSAEEILKIFKSDLTVLADYLGDKPFLTGDKPCVADCSAFGLLGQLLWHDSNPKTVNLLREDYPTLVQFCERMKERFWPDWDQCKRELKQ